MTEQEEGDPTVGAPDGWRPADPPPLPRSGPDDPFDGLEPRYVAAERIDRGEPWYRRRLARLGATVLLIAAVVAALAGLVLLVAAEDDDSGPEVLGVRQINPQTDAAPDPTPPPVTTPATSPTAVAPTPTATAAPEPTVEPAILLYRLVADAGIALDQLELVAAQVAPVPFVIQDYLPDGWGDPDGDCRSTRDIVLAAASVEPVVWSVTGCEVESGAWVDAWSGEPIDDIADAVVAHVVPPAHAHVADAWQWEPDRREAFVNDADPRAIQVVSQATFDARADAVVTAWRPPSEATWCAFAFDWIDIKTRWELTVTADEQVVLGEMIGSCLEPDSGGPPENWVAG